MSTLFLIGALIMTFLVIVYTKDRTYEENDAYKDLPFAGMTRYQIIPDKFENGDTTNDSITRSLDWLPFDQTLLEAYTTYPQSRTGDWFTFHTGEQDIYDYLVTAKHRNKKVAYGYILRQRWYGGDFAGIRKRIPYLKDLGIKGVFLNPVWLAYSPMRYDVSDYRHIDPRLSSISQQHDFPAISKTERARSEADTDFLSLINEFHEAGMKVIIDIAFTHSSSKSIFLEDIAMKGKQSQYYERFDMAYSGDDSFTRMKCQLSDYRTGSAYEQARYIRMNSRRGHCPLVYAKKTAEHSLHPGLEERYLRMIDRWMKPQRIDGKKYDGVDGIRVDTAPELPGVFKQKIYAHTKKIKPGSIILIEDRSNNFLCKTLHQCDGGTNYFTRTLAEFFMIGKNAQLYDINTFPRLLDQEYGKDTIQDRSYTFNQLNSHDTDRVFSKLIFTNREQNQKKQGIIAEHEIPEKGFHIWDDTQINQTALGATYIQGKPDEKDKALLRTLIMFQFMLPGAPTLYYGDERGMRGGNDPDNRKPMTRPEYVFDPQSSCPYTNETYCGLSERKNSVGGNEDIYDLYKKLIGLRSHHDALWNGYVEAYKDSSLTKEGFLGFARIGEKEKIYFFTNQSPLFTGMSFSIKTPHPLTDFFDPLTENIYTTNTAGSLSLSLAPEESIILIQQ